MIHYTVKVTTLETILPLRHEVLRSGLSFESAYFELDQKPGKAIHFGAFHKNNLIGTITLLKENSSLHNHNIQWRIRGMAVKENFQRSGIGTALIIFALDTVQECQPLVWMNARLTAVAFYEKHGFIKQGSLFNGQNNSGPHYHMYQLLNSF